MLEGVQRGSLIAAASIFLLTPIRNFLEGGMHILVKLNVILIRPAFLAVGGRLQDFLKALWVEAGPLWKAQHFLWVFDWLSELWLHGTLHFKQEIGDQRVLLILGIAGLDPHLQGPPRKLFHDDIPVIQLRVLLAIGRFCISWRLLLVFSMSRKTSASAWEGRLCRER